MPGSPHCAPEDRQTAFGQLWPFLRLQLYANFGHAAVVSWKAKRARCPAPGRSSPLSMLLVSTAAAIHDFMAVARTPGGAAQSGLCRRVGWLCLMRTSRALPVAAAQQATITFNPINRDLVAAQNGDGS